MIQGIDVTQRIEFVDPNDTGDPKTVFVLRPLTASEILTLRYSTTDNAMRIFNTIKASIVEAKNYFKSFEDKDKLVDSLPMNLITSLSLKIAEINHLQAEEIKNS